MSASSIRIAIAATLLGVSAAHAGADVELYAAMREGVKLDEEFNFALSVAAGKARGARAQLVINRRDDGNLLVLEITGSGLRLTRVLRGTASVLGEAAGARLLAGKTVQLLVKRRKGQVIVAAGGHEIIRAGEPDLSGGGLGLGTRGGARVASAKYQKTGPVEFSDDFMRADQGTDPWTRRSGEWRTAESPFAELFSGAFRMEGRAEAGSRALAAAGHEFWDDYFLSAAVSPVSGLSGLSFYSRRGAGRFEFLLDVSGGGEAVLLRVGPDGKALRIGSARVRVRSGRWYAMAAAVVGAEARCYLDGHKIFGFTDKRLVGGRIGLAAAPSKDQEGRATFDDARCRDVPCPSAAELDAPGSKVLAGLLAPESATTLRIPTLYASQTSIHPWAQESAVWRRAFDRSLWHQTTVFGECALKCRSRGRGLNRGEIGLTIFGDGEKINSGYHMAVERKEGERSARVAMHKGGELFAETELQLGAGNPTKELEIGLSRSGVPAGQARLTARVDGKAAFDIVDREPITSGQAGGRVRGRLLTAASLELCAPGATDTTFGTAPTGWLPQSGQWRARSRWSCQPQHTWYGCGPGVSVLWSKRSMPGDSSIEFYGAVRMAERRMPMYDRPVNMGCAISADGRDPASGYALYFGIQDVPVCLLRDGVVVARSSVYHQPAMRHDPFSLYRETHKAWWRVGLVRSGGLVRGLINGRKVLEYRDEKPLEGDRACIFTSGANGLMVSRAMTSAPGLVNASPLGEAAPVALRPGAGGEVAAAAAAALKPSADEGARVGTVKTGGELHRVVVKDVPGGVFRGSVEGVGPVDLSATPRLEATVERSATACVDLFAEVDGKLYRVRLWGPDDDGPALPLADLSDEVRGRTEAKIAVDLGLAISRYLDGRGPKLEALHVGCVGEEPLLAASLSGNRVGDWALVKGVRFGGRALAAQAPPARTRPAPGTLFADDFETQSAGWLPFGGAQAAEAERVPGGPGGSRWCLRLRAADVGSVLGLEWPVEPYDARSFPVIRFDYRVDPLAQVDVYFETASGWQCIAFTDPEHGRELVGAFRDVLADGKWQTATFDLAAAMRARYLRDTAVRRIIFCNLGTNGVVSGSTWFLDNVSVGGGVAGAAPEKPRANAPSSRPPAAPYVSCVRPDALLGLTFEPGEPGGDIRPGQSAPSARRGAMTTPDRFHSATGEHSLAIVKRKPGNYLGAYISRTPFRASEHPVVEFDVMMKPGGRGAVMFPINRRFYVVELYGRAHDHLLGRADGITDDGRWHHVRFDLARLMTAAGLDPTVTIPYVATRKTEESGIDSWIYIDNFQMHSERSRNVRVMWKPGERRRVKGYSFVLDRARDTEPDTEAEGPATEKTCRDLEPGRWFFHVRAVDAEARWGKTAHFGFEVRR